MAVQTDNHNNSGSLMYKNSKCEARLGSIVRPCVKKKKKKKKEEEKGGGGGGGEEEEEEGEEEGEEEKKAKRGKWRKWIEEKLISLPFPTPIKYHYLPS